MNKTAFTLLEDSSSAKSAVKEWLDSGVDQKMIYLASVDSSEDNPEAVENVAHRGWVGARIGISVGGGGGALLGWMTLTMSEVGGVVSVNPLLAVRIALLYIGMGAGIGALIFAILGALMDIALLRETAWTVSDESIHSSRY